jgi:anti-sigma B factor antagonist
MEAATNGNLRIIEGGPLSLRSFRDGSTSHLIELVGELDMTCAARLSDELERVEASDAQTIVLDLGRLTYVDSTGLRVFLLAAKRSAHGDRLRLRGATDHVHRLLELTGAVAMLELED